MGWVAWAAIVGLLAATGCVPLGGGDGEDGGVVVLPGDGAMLSDGLPLPDGATSDAATDASGSARDGSSPSDGGGPPSDAQPRSDGLGPPLDDVGPPPPRDAAPPPPDAAPLPPDAAVPCDPDDCPLEDRTEDQVCDHWREQHLDVAVEWVAGPNPEDRCDLGSVPGDAQQNGIRRTNLYRWLVGLGPVRLDPARIPVQQACAVVQAAMGRLDHNPPPDAPCYTPEAAQGAGSSNLALGAGLADSVDLYVGDVGVASLGHRRWVLNPSAQVTAFGFKPRGGCMYSFSMGGPVDVDFVAWPPPGPVPAAAGRGPFHVSLYGVRPADDFSVLVGLDRAEPAVVEARSLQIGFGGQVPAYEFEPPGGFAAAWVAGRRVRVVLRGLRDHPDIDYVTRFVDCR